MNFDLDIILGIIMSLFKANSSSTDHLLRTPSLPTESFQENFKKAFHSGIFYISKSFSEIGGISKLSNIATKIIKFVQIIFGEDQFPILDLIKKPIKTIKNVTSIFKVADKTHDLLLLNQQTPKLRIVHKVTSLFTSILKTVKFFGALKLIDLGKHAATLGKIPVFGIVSQLPLGIVINIFQFVVHVLGSIEDAADFFSLSKHTKGTDSSLNKWNKRSDNIDNILSYVRNEAKLRDLRTRANLAPEAEIENIEVFPKAVAVTKQENSQSVLREMIPLETPNIGVLQSKTPKGNDIIINTVRDIEIKYDQQTFEKNKVEKALNIADKTPESMDKLGGLTKHPTGLTNNEIDSLVEAVKYPIKEQEKVQNLVNAKDPILTDEFNHLTPANLNVVPDDLNFNSALPEKTKKIEENPPMAPVPVILDDKDPLKNSFTLKEDPKGELLSSIDQKDSSEKPAQTQQESIKDEIKPLGIQQQQVLKIEEKDEIDPAVKLPKEPLIQNIVKDIELELEIEKLQENVNRQLNSIVNERDRLCEYYRKKIQEAQGKIHRLELSETQQMHQWDAKIIKWEHLVDIIAGNDELLINELKKKCDLKKVEKKETRELLKQAKIQRAFSFVYRVAKVVLAASAILLFVTGIGSTAVLAGFIALNVTIYSFGLFKFFWKESHKLDHEKLSRKLTGTQWAKGT